MSQPLIVAAMGVSLSAVNRAHTVYDQGGIKALKPRPSGGRKRENMTLEEEKALMAHLGQDPAGVTLSVETHATKSSGDAPCELRGASIRWAVRSR
jgi:transposase